MACRTNMRGAVDTMVKDKLTNKDGDLTNLGEKTVTIAAGEAVSAMFEKEKIGKESKEIMGKLYAEAYKSALHKTNNKEEATKFANGVVAQYKGKTGKAFLNQLTQNRAGSFVGSNSIVLGNGVVFSGAMSAGGQVSGTVS